MHARNRLCRALGKAFGQYGADGLPLRHVRPPIDARIGKKSRKHLNHPVDVIGCVSRKPLDNAERFCRRKPCLQHGEQLVGKPSRINLVVEAPLPNRTEFGAICIGIGRILRSVQPESPYANRAAASRPEGPIPTAFRDTTSRAAAGTRVRSAKISRASRPAAHPRDAI